MVRSSTNTKWESSAYRQTRTSTIFRLEITLERNVCWLVASFDDDSRQTTSTFAENRIIYSENYCRRGQTMPRESINGADSFTESNRTSNSELQTPNPNRFNLWQPKRIQQINQSFYECNFDYVAKTPALFDYRDSTWMLNGLEVGRLGQFN